MSSEYLSLQCNCSFIWHNNSPHNDFILIICIRIFDLNSPFLKTYGAFNNFNQRTKLIISYKISKFVNK